MVENVLTAKKLQFYGLKIAKKEQIGKHVFSLEFVVPEDLREIFRFQSGQYIALKFNYNGAEIINDYSIITAPFEEKITIAIKINREGNTADFLFKNFAEGNVMQISAPQGRFTLASKPHEFRTILGFAGGIGITPIFSHFKNILYTEPRSRLFLFYSVKNQEDIIFENDFEILKSQYGERLQIFYFYSQEKHPVNLFSGRIDHKKLKLIINQILHSDDTDEESTIWDAVDEVLICGKGEMIKSVANACFDNGIPKKNIHFELFESFNEDIYPQEKTYRHVENIKVDFKINRKNYTTTLADNSAKILQQLLIQQFPVPYSCKSGICGSCICMLESGKVELFENEYLTEKEEAEGKILACMAVPLSKNLRLNFDFE